MPSTTLYMVLFWCLILLVDTSFGQDILSGKEEANAVTTDEELVTISANASHLYISNNEKSKIGVLFGIETREPNDMKMDSKEASRLPYELAIVLDRSGSMSGNKLEQSKLAILAIIDNMSKYDIIHIIVYHNWVETLVFNGTLTTIEERQSIINSVKNIGTGGSTNLYGGIEAGFNAIANNNNKNNIDNGNIPCNCRIFLFSDGLVNVGHFTRFEDIIDNIKRLKENAMTLINKDIYISSFGIGYDFDRELMVSIANVGKGDFFYIESANDIGKVVEIARKGTESLIATDAKLTIKAISESAKYTTQIKDMFGRNNDVLKRNQVSNENSINIFDLRMDDVKLATIELEIEASMNELIDDNGEREANILEYCLEYKYIGKNKQEMKKLCNKLNIIVTNDKTMHENGEKSIDQVSNAQWLLAQTRNMEQEILNDLKDGDFERAQKIYNKRYQTTDYVNRVYTSYVPSMSPSMAPTLAEIRRSDSFLSSVATKLESRQHLTDTEYSQQSIRAESNHKLNQMASSLHQEL